MRSPNSYVALAVLVAAAAAAVCCMADYPLYDYTFICDQERYQKLGLEMHKFPFCDKALSYQARAKSLVDLMTLSEKAQQMGNAAPGVARLGIPRYNWWSEALHGVSDVGGGSAFGNIVPGATSFPTPILAAASFNASLWLATGEAVSTEARAMHEKRVGGLTFWSPNVNLVRDPRWGRIMETPGEDPLVVGLYAVNYVRGLQDVQSGEEYRGDPEVRPLKVSACCKHYAAYDVDAWYDKGNFYVDRYHFSANVTEQDMVETFLRPFEMCVRDGDVSSVMCSYNEVNGIPTCTDARLLRGTVRKDWNLHGYIVADCDSIEVVVDGAKYLGDSPIDAVAQVIHGGLNLDCMTYYQKYLADASSQGRVKESDIDELLVKNYIVLMRLGLFDGQPLYSGLTPADVCSPAHVELARDSARQGIVLLKNNGVLPLNAAKHANISVVGPHVDATHVMLGNYEGRPCNVVSPLEGLKAYAKNVVTQPGCVDVSCSSLDHIFPAVRVVRDADATIIITGIDRSIEEESRDRTSLDLPGYQKLFIRSVASASPGPVVLVVLSAGCLDIEEFQNSGDIDAIIWAGYSGEQGGNAIADVIYGAYNPGGRLPITWYRPDYVFQLPMTSMQLRPNDEFGFPGRTYKFYNGTVIYPFGYGLSYTQFSYEVVSAQKHVQKALPSVAHCHQLKYDQAAYVPPCHAALAADLECAGTDIAVDVNVTNTGAVDGSEVVILYSRAPQGLVGVPLKQVVAFQRVFVGAGETVTAHFELDACKALGIVTDTAYEVLPAGEHAIIVGSGYNELGFPFHVYLKTELSDLSY